MIKAKNRNYYVNEKQIKSISCQNGTYYASDLCLPKYEIEELDYFSIKQLLESKVYKQMCSNCPNAKKCHEECITCEEYDNKLGEIVNG